MRQFKFFQREWGSRISLGGMFAVITPTQQHFLEWVEQNVPDGYHTNLGDWVCDGETYYHINRIDRMVGRRFDDYHFYHIEGMRGIEEIMSRVELQRMGNRELGYV